MEEKETVEMSAGTIQFDTVPKMFWHGVQTRAGRVICRQKELGIWKQVTWDELGRAAREIGMGLVSLGYEPGEVASILANTRQEWVYADLGALGAAGVVNGIYPTDSQAQVEYLMTDSGSVFVFVEDDEQLDKLLEVRMRLPRLRKIIVLDMEGLEDLNEPQVISLDALRALGREHDAAHPDEWQRRIGLRKPEDLAILVYTSGTTGKPKGAMLSHRSIVTTCEAYQNATPQDERDERMAFLPLCHIAELIGGEYHPIYTGSVVNFVENPDTVPENVREIAPTIFTGVPRVWEKFY
jgi:long-chain acyl-CoA synthetase